MNNEQAIHKHKEIIQSLISETGIIYEFPKDDFDKKDVERINNESVAKKVFQPWLYILEQYIHFLSGLWAMYTSRVVFHSEVEPPADKLTVSVLSLLSSACSYAVAVRTLVLSGLDNPARSAARSLDEHLSVCIALLYTPELAHKFVESQDEQSSNDFWYQNFRTKDLNKHLNKAERAHGIPQHVSEQIRQRRTSELKTFSQTVHPSFGAGFMAAHPIDVFDTNKVKLGIFGGLSAASERTLSHACSTIDYFSQIGCHRMKSADGKFPHLSVESSDPNVKNLSVLRYSLCKLYEYYYNHTIFDFPENSFESPK